MTVRASLRWRLWTLALFGGIAGATGIVVGEAGATLPPPTISDLHVTNFDPFLDPSGASYDATTGTFDTAGVVAFDSQGFDFVNQFTNGQLSVTIGGHNLDFVHTYGLCGGMTYAALDTFLAGNGTTTPAGSQASSSGPGLAVPPESGPVFDYLYARQQNSLESDNFSALREMLHMMLVDPYESERERETSHYFGAITASIAAGQPVPLMLVEALSLGQVFENHQVLATGYFYRGGPAGQLVLQVYDPNFPGRFMYLNTHNTYGDMAEYPSEIETYDATGNEYSGVHFYGFFTTPYSYVAPPWAHAAPTGNLLEVPGADWADSSWNLTTDASGHPPGTVESGHPPGTVETPETGLGAVAGTASVVTPPDWNPVGNLTAVQYVPIKRLRPPGTGPAFLTAVDSTGIAGDENYFAGGPNNSWSSAVQSIDLTSDFSLDAAIDGGQQEATLSGDLGGSGSEPAAMVVTASFESAAGIPLPGAEETLGKVSIGPVSAADRSDHTELLAQSATALVPKGTRTIEMTITANGQGDTSQYNTAFADNLSLTIAPSTHVPVPLPIDKIPVATS